MYLNNELLNCTVEHKNVAVNNFIKSYPIFKILLLLDSAINLQLEMWANAQRDGRPAEYRWRPLFNAAKFG